MPDARPLPSAHGRDSRGRDQEEVSMRKNRSMPPSTVIPVLVYVDVDQAVEWLCETFGFTPRWRAGNHRAQLWAGDGVVVVSGGAADADGHRDSVMVRVEDVDAHHAHARQRGAHILQPPADFPYGERQYTVEDIAGRRWAFSRSIADVAPEEWGGTSFRIE
jgi:uncharacterized glyoxalase superfamily protein PhnB